MKCRIYTVLINAKLQSEERCALITILIADDQTLMRDGLHTILSLQEDFRIVGMAANGEEAVKLAQEHRPQVILMDIRMPIMDGLACTRKIKAILPDTEVLVLTTFSEDEYIIEALAGGATGFLLKDIPGEKLAVAIREAVRGEYMLPSSVARRLAARISATDASAQAMLHASRMRTERIQLSNKEVEIARAMVEGKTNKEIAAALYMSEGTVKNYVSALYAKLGTKDRMVAVMTLKQWLSSES